MKSSPGDTVTLVHSLVSGGAAERDGRLQKGDKLISINGLSVVNKSLDFTVGQLKSVPLVREGGREGGRREGREGGREGGEGREGGRRERRRET